MHKAFEKVKNLETGAPIGNFGWAGKKWGTLLATDFLFGISSRRNEKENIIKKIEGNSSIHRAFKKVHDECVAKLIANNPVPYDGPLKVPEIQAEDFTRDFLSKWRKYNKSPLVIKGYIKGAPIQDFATKESLNEVHGDMKVFAVSDMLEVKKKLGQNVELAETTLGDFLTNPDYEDYYVNNLSGFLNDNDFSEKCRGNEIDKVHGSKNLITQWFISRSNKTGSSLHCAGGDNIFLNILGQKEWHFIHPSYSSVLQTSVQENGIYAFSEVHKKINDGYEGMIESTPYLKHVPIYNVVLEEGDILYNPPLWWHAVKNLTNYNVGCATRYNGWISYSKAIQVCNFFAIVKHPTKNPLTNAIQLLINKRKQKHFYLPIYSKKKEAVAG